MRCGIFKTLVLAATFCFNLSAFNVHAYTVAYDFHATSEFASPHGNVPPLPAEILNATQWDIAGSILFDDNTFENEGIVGGSLSINGISLGDFTGASYREGYSDEPPEPGDDPDYANFAIWFDSEEFGPSFFSIFSEDYSGGISYGNAQSFLQAYPVGGYQSTEVMVGEWPNAWEVFFAIDDGFGMRDVEGPGVQVTEASSMHLLALGLACLLWLGWRQGRLVPVKQQCFQYADFQ